MIIGLVGNVIVVAVITTLRKRGQKASVQLFFLHLAISDLMVCLLCIPLTIFTNFNYPTEKRDIGLCKISRFMQVLELLLCTSQFEISTLPTFHLSPKTHAGTGTPVVYQSIRTLDLSPSSRRKLMQVLKLHYVPVKSNSHPLSHPPPSPPPPPTLFSPHNTGAFFYIRVFYLESYTINSISTISK